MAMNETDRSSGGVRGPRSCHPRPNSTPTWYQIGLFAGAKLGTLRMDFNLFGLARRGDSSLVTPFSCNNSKEAFWASKLLKTATCDIFIAKSPPKLAPE